MTASAPSGNCRTQAGHARVVLAAAALVCLASFATASLADALSERPGAGRDAVWREIFKRPDALPTPAPDPDQAVLGQRLFNDPRLSGNGDMACATCHQQTRAFTDGRTRGQGRDGAPLDRNVPTLLNLAWGTSFFWDGRAKSLEEQARGPLLSRNEMAASMPELLAALASDPETKALFEKAFPGEEGVREETLLAALAAYERTLVSPRTRFDRWVEGDDEALTDQQREGFSIFVGKGACVSCHGGWRFTDDTRHDIGLEDVGGAAPSMKTPSLRETRHTAPYMHDGSKATLREVIDHYAGNLHVRPTLANNVVRNLSLTDREKQSLVAFLETLSSDAKK